MMRVSIFFLCVFAVQIFLAPGVAIKADDRSPVADEVKLVSKFFQDVDPERPLPEYPRPQMSRAAWLNLNGPWDYAVTDNDGDRVTDYQGKITVPYPIESALSGVEKTVGKEKRLWYRRFFELPTAEAWKHKKILLHFGAVDWQATVFVNGRQAGTHSGGYSPFTFDITDLLNPEGRQEIVVAVWDPTDDGFQPIGKQVEKPQSIWYTSVTGIWQTVWLEPVSETSVERLRMLPNLRDRTLKLDVFHRGGRPGDVVRAQAEADSGNGKKTVFLQERPLGPDGAGTSLLLSLADGMRTWSPDSPFLYELKVTLLRDGEVVDMVDSYFGMREITLAKDRGGVTRMMLNGRFLFQHGLLDQGWWPDGLYTAPTDEALYYDIEITKKLGFNMLRKHVKVEPARFYYHCDRLGILVWQDMPSGEPTKYIKPNDPDAVRSKESAEQFEKELVAMMEFLENAPSIVVWVPFNEGWGQYDTCRILEMTKKLDPSRLVAGPSGWADRGCGDLHDRHLYRGPGMFPPEEHRASVLGEYGGLGLPVRGHSWVESSKNWGYRGNMKDRDELFKTYLELNSRLHPMIEHGLSAAIYTQTTDVEIEVNGLVTYDRHVVKVDVDAVRASNLSLHKKSPEKVILPTATLKSVPWSFTTESPKDGWEQTEFDDSAWEKGKSGFGRSAGSNTSVGTPWNTNDIWLRTDFELSDEDVSDPSCFGLVMFHDDDVEVYINGTRVFQAVGTMAHYAFIPIEIKQEVLKAGKNVLAVHCRMTGQGQYIDVGISRKPKTD